MESQALDGEPVFFALLKGKFRLDEQNLATNEDELQEPDPDELEGQFVADANGNVYAAAKGEDKRESVRQLFYNVAGDDTEAGSTDTETSSTDTETVDPVSNTDEGSTTL